MKLSWGIFCTRKEVDTIKDKLTKKRLEVFEVRRLTMEERLIYVNDMRLFNNDPHIVMFYATKWQYRMFLLSNGLSKVF